jgi:putative ABC transport system permease protein
VAANYADDARLAKLLATATATAIALVIAAFGTYTLAAHTVQRRAREIALRKLYGATPRDVGRLMARETGLLAVMAALGALPVAALLIHLHLTGYAHRLCRTGGAESVSGAADRARGHAPGDRHRGGAACDGKHAAAAGGGVAKLNNPAKTSPGCSRFSTRGHTAVSNL